MRPARISFGALVAVSYFATVMASVCVGLLIVSRIVGLPVWVGGVLLATGAALVAVPLLCFALFRPVRQTPMTLGDIVTEFFENFIPPWP